MFQGDGGVIDFGEMPGGISRTRAIKLLNRGRADIPLKLVISGVGFMFIFINTASSHLRPPLVPTYLLIYLYDDIIAIKMYFVRC